MPHEYPQHLYEKKRGIAMYNIKIDQLSQELTNHILKCFGHYKSESPVKADY